LINPSEDIITVERYNKLLILIKKTIHKTSLKKQLMYLYDLLLLIYSKRNGNNYNLSKSNLLNTVPEIYSSVINTLEKYRDSIIVEDVERQNSLLDTLIKERVLLDYLASLCDVTLSWDNPLVTIKDWKYE